MLITVFTPTYNRAHLLPRLYESLCRQTFTDFEWVIVDDGSVDNTKSLVNKFLVDKTQHSTLNTNFKTQNSKLKTNSIRYFYQENGGKHRAINRGVKEAQGELFFIADSDDSLPPDALEQVARVFETVRGDESFGGVCGYMAHHDGTVIGHGNDAEILDTNSIDLRNKYHVQGDMMEVFRTEVMREFPFPEIPNERFVPEMLVWNRIATKYKLRVFHKVIYYRDYLDGGLTDKIVRIRMQSPVASMMTYAEMTRYDIPLIQKVKAAVNFWRFYSPARTEGERAPKLRWWWWWTMPLGQLMHMKDVHISH